MRGVGRGRRETEMDGVKSLAVQGQRHGENSQMHRGDRGERLWKNDKSRSWGRRDNEQSRRGGGNSV